MNNISQIASEIAPAYHIVDDAAAPNNEGAHIRDHNCYSTLISTEDEEIQIQWQGVSYDGSMGKTFENDYKRATCDGMDTCMTEGTSCLECDSIEQTTVQIALDSNYALTDNSPTECKSGGADFSWPEGTLDYAGNAVPDTGVSMGCYQWQE